MERPLAISSMLRVLVGLTAALVLVGPPLAAQTIRGTVVDADTKLPIFAVSVTLIDDAGTEVPPSVRSDSLGNFVVHAARAGLWRVKAMRIGYGPVTSDPVSLPIGGLAVVRLQMTTVAQRLLPVQVVEQRQLSANELMSTSGFDLRQRRGLGRFLSGERLAAMGHDGLREVLATQFEPVLYVYADSVLGDVLRIGAFEPGERLHDPLPVELLDIVDVFADQVADLDQRMGDQQVSLRRVPSQQPAGDRHPLQQRSRFLGEKDSRFFGSKDQCDQNLSDPQRE